MIWTQRDGTQMPVSDMSNEHLTNAATMLVRANRAVPDGMRAEFARRGLSVPCEHGWTDFDFCPECSDDVLAGLVPSGGPSTDW